LLLLILLLLLPPPLPEEEEEDDARYLAAMPHAFVGVVAAVIAHWKRDNDVLRAAVRRRINTILLVCRTI
jgi:hypothetical protein